MSSTCINMPRILIIIISVGFSCTTLAQSGDAGRSYQRARALDQAYDLPYLTVDELTPNVASDQSTLVLYAPDSMKITLEIEAWMNKGKSLWQETIKIGPGRQEVQVPLFGLVEGRYTVLISRRRQVLGARHLEVSR